MTYINVNIINYKYFWCSGQTSSEPHREDFPAANVCTPHHVRSQQGTTDDSPLLVVFLAKQRIYIWSNAHHRRNVASVWQPTIVLDLGYQHGTLRLAPQDYLQTHTRLYSVCDGLVDESCTINCYQAAKPSHRIFTCSSWNVCNRHCAKGNSIS